MADNKSTEMVDADIYIWLDEGIETSPKSRALKTRIQQMVKGRFQAFTSPDECVDYLTDDITQKIFLIISNRFGGYIVPFIHDAEQIDTIYVYCGNRQAAESWRKPYSKVREIFIQEASLLKQIHNNVNTSNESANASVCVFNQGKEFSLKALSDQCTKFLWYQAVLRVLRHMAKHLNAKNDMIKASREQCSDNKGYQEKINEFELTYTSDKAFSWYTDTGFVYRLLNQALRKQNMDIIFKFRFFINDLHDEIEKLYRKYLNDHKGEQLTFYRGQQLGMADIEVLKASIGGLISMNSFLSTSRDPKVADFFFGGDAAYDEKSDVHPVLFVIDVCDIDEETTPFAFIKRFSCNQEEDEVLFTISAIFKVESVEKKNNTWHIHLTLSKQKQNQQHKDFSNYMMQQLGTQPGPTSFGWFLYRRGNFDEAIRYAENILDQLSMEDTEMADAYNLLGLIYKDLKNPEKAVEYYDKALEVCSRSTSIHNTQIISIHYNASLAHLALGDNRVADEHRRDANSLLMNSLDSNHPLLIAMTKSLNAMLESVHGNHASAFQSLEAILADKKTKLPEKNPSSASTLNEMGIVQERMGNDERALGYFQQALEMCSDCLTTNHLDLADYHANIGRIRFKRREYEQALEQFESAYKIMMEYKLENTENFSTIMRCLSDANDHVNPRRDDEEEPIK